MKVVLVTGGFDPLHSGHIEYFHAAKELGDILVVGLNSDEWLSRKKGRPFMPFKERSAVIHELKVVGRVFQFDDEDDTALAAIDNCLEYFPQNSEIIFANGGDRDNKNIPETNLMHPRVSFEFGVGGDKKNSSSWILDEWKTQKTERDWGYWRVLDDKPDKGYKVKELVIYPGKSLSNQRHFKRSESWTVLSGTVGIITEDSDSTASAYEDNYEIPIGVWHRAFNPGSDNAHVIEIQRGTCDEDDIERK